MRKRAVVMFSILVISIVGLMALSVRQAIAEVLTISWGAVKIKYLDADLITPVDGGTTTNTNVPTNTNTPPPPKQ